MALSLIPGRQLPLPGVCISCGSTGIDMIDTGKNEAYYGALLICIVCFRDGALRIPELNLYSKPLHDDIVADLEEKIEWRNSLEPTVAQLATDISIALDRARHGFRQRHITNSPSNEVLANETGFDSIGSETSSGVDDNPEQLFFTLESLREHGNSERQSDDNDSGQIGWLGEGERQIDDDVRNEKSA